MIKLSFERPAKPPVRVFLAAGGSALAVQSEDTLDLHPLSGLTVQREGCAVIVSGRRYEVGEAYDVVFRQITCLAGRSERRRNWKVNAALVLAALFSGTELAYSLLDGPEKNLYGTSQPTAAAPAAPPRAAGPPSGALGDFGLGR